MAKVDMRKLRVEFQKQAFNTNQFKGLAKGIAQRRANIAKLEMQKTFENSRVTQELDAGPNSPNISGTISYFSDKGNPNLYTFIGFPVGTRPTEALRELLKESVIVHHSRRTKNTYHFRIETITEEDIEAVTPMPYWMEGASWAQGVEDGTIPNISQYLSLRAGRSTGGIQVEAINVPSEFRASPYITQILNAFRDRLQELSN